MFCINLYVVGHKCNVRKDFCNISKGYVTYGTYKRYICVNVYC